VLFYFITITPKWFVFGYGSRWCQTKSNTAVQNAQNFTISVPLCYFCAGRPIVRKIPCVQNRRILKSLVKHHKETQPEQQQYWYWYQ